MTRFCSISLFELLSVKIPIQNFNQSHPVWLNWAVFRQFSYSRVKFQFKNWNLSQTVWPDWAVFAISVTLGLNSNSKTQICLRQYDQFGQNFSIWATFSQNFNTKLWSVSISVTRLGNISAFGQLSAKISMPKL